MDGLANVEELKVEVKNPMLLDPGTNEDVVVSGLLERNAAELVDELVCDNSEVLEDSIELLVVDGDVLSRKEELLILDSEELNIVVNSLELPPSIELKSMVEDATDTAVVSRLELVEISNLVTMLGTMSVVVGPKVGILIDSLKLIKTSELKEIVTLGSPAELVD